MAIRLGLISLLILALGCAEGHCRRKADEPAAAKSVNAPVESTPSESSSVFVYKYDGSLQCAKGKVISLEAMGKELGSIPVLSSVKKKDGLIHIQVCGSATGMANVFEIPSKFLKQAESKGFKKWSFE